MFYRIFRAVAMVCITAIGIAVGYAIGENSNIVDMEQSGILMAFLLGMIGYLLASISTRSLDDWIEKEFHKVKINTLTWSSYGILTGILVINLPLLPFYLYMPRLYTEHAPSNEYLKAAYSMLLFAVPVLLNLLSMYIFAKIFVRYASAKHDSALSPRVAVKIIDASALIDGRFMDLLEQGFLEGEIVVPKFVFNELLFLSDSKEEIQANRGSRGMRVLTELKTMFPDSVSISEQDFGDLNECHDKLIALAKELDANIITQDYPLKKLAELENIKVLNLNELSNALKPIYSGGEKLEVKIVKPGKEAGQGVGFLSDGTMIVVDDAENRVGEILFAEVTNILQTGAGRMVFCKLSEDNK